MKIRATIPRKKQDSRSGINTFLETLGAHLLHHFSVDEVTSLTSRCATFLEQTLRELPPRIDLWKRLIKMYQPKYIVAQDVSYGNTTGILSLVAKSAGVKVIEDQHGWLGEHHPAYNHYSKSEALGFLPDVLWGYGPRWLEKLHLPVRKVCIGNPHLAEKTKSIQHIKKQYGMLVLVDAQAFPPHETCKLTRLLLGTVEKILFRPHPVELSTARVTYASAIEKKEVTLDTGRDVYQSIAKISTVVIIGDYVSTVGYEALAFGRRLIVISDLNQPVLGATCVKGLALQLDYRDPDLIEKLRACLDEESVDNQPQDLYHLNWKQNLRDFIQEQEQ